MTVGPQRANPDISYRVLHDQGQSRGEIKSTVLAHHPEHGVIGLLHVDNSQWSRGRGGIPEQRKMGGKGLAVSLIHTRPDFQKRGIGSAMYNIARRELGYAPGHDVTRTPAGNRFAQSVSGGEGGRGHIPGGAKPPQPMAQWGTTVEDTAGMAKIQAPYWAKGTDVDPTLASALTPQRAKPSRRRKAVQGQLFDTAPYETKKKT
jgi:GNAT superfamily N-acetyltransferase